MQRDRVTTGVAGSEGPASPAVRTLLDTFHARTPIRAGSLVVTIFGDAVVPRGGVMSLASLLLITRALRLSDGVVRTALSRLVADGWFERSKAGRNSFYRLTSRGRDTFADATDRIYNPVEQGWNGRFDAVLLDDDDGRGGLRAALSAAGYGQLTGDLMIAPSRPHSPVAPGSPMLGLTIEAKDDTSARRLAQRIWPLDDLERRYARFVELYAPVAASIRAEHTWCDLETLIVRILLIHDFRRAVLSDPRLPAALSPKNWSGDGARRLCGEIYRVVVASAERWLDRWGESDDGPLPGPVGDFHARFATH